jgi:methyltransferase (TIGR00027 family)
MAVRSRFFDDIIQLNCNIRAQVVIVAAGMDTRYLRLSVSENVKSFPPFLTRQVEIFELDFPEVLEYKRHKLEQDPNTPDCKCKHTLIGLDLREDGWAEVLISKGYNPQAPSIWLIEGLETI